MLVGSIERRSVKSGAVCLIMQPFSMERKLEKSVEHLLIELIQRQKHIDNTFPTIAYLQSDQANL